MAKPKIDVASDDGGTQSTVSPPIRAAQIVLALAGIAGAALHAFPLAVREEHQNYPVTDLITLAWFGLVALAAAFPSISEVAFGNLTIKTRQLRTASNNYENTLKDLAKLTERWSVAAPAYFEKMQRDDADLDRPRDRLFSDYVNDRLSETYEFLATVPDEVVRIALWLYDPVSKTIVFSDGFGILPLRESYPIGVGMIGKCFEDNRSINEGDVRSVPSYEPSRTGDPPYRAVLCEPVRYANQPIGAITADRSTAGYFDDVSVAVVRALAAQCALAFSVTYERFGATPGPGPA